MRGAVGDFRRAGEVVFQDARSDVIAQDHDVESWATSVGGGRPLNNGFFYISLKPRTERKSNVTQTYADVPGISVPNAVC